MSSPRLPLDLCEEVIDRCAPPQWDALTTARFWSVHVAASAKALIACALTCRAWVRRSVFRYYSTCLILEDANSVDRLVSPISKHPDLAAYVRTLSVHSTFEDYDGSTPLRGAIKCKYVPFRRTDLAQNLQHLDTIVYRAEGEWPYPPKFNVPIGQCRSLRTLSLSARFPRPIDLCRLIWALEQLQTLHLHQVVFDQTYPPGYEDPLDPGYEILFKMATRRSRCQFLETLMIDMGVLLSRTFPYGCVFGTSVTRCGVSVPMNDLASWRMANPDSLRSLNEGPQIYRYIASAAILEELLLEFSCMRPKFVLSVDDIIHCLKHTIALRARSHPSLRRLTIRLLLYGPGKQKILGSFFRANRPTGDRLGDIFNQLSNLQELVIQVDWGTSQGQAERVPSYQTRRTLWFDYVRDAMPNLKAKLSVIENGCILVEGMRPDPHKNHIAIKYRETARAESSAISHVEGTRQNSAARGESLEDGKVARR